MAIFQKTIQGLIDGMTYYVRVYPINPKGAAQSELGGQVASAIPKARHLPDGYTELTYIESGSNQILDTGIYPTANTKFVAGNEVA